MHKYHVFNKTSHKKVLVLKHRISKKVSILAQKKLSYKKKRVVVLTVVILLVFRALFSTGKICEGPNRKNKYVIKKTVTLRRENINMRQIDELFVFIL